MPASKLSHVRKRDNRLVPFDPDKIISSIERAARSCGHDDSFFSREIAEAVILFLEKNFSNSYPETKNIAESVVNVLLSLNHDDIASAYQTFQYERETSRVKCTVWKPAQPSLFDTEFGLQVTINGGQRTMAWDRTRITRALEKEAKISNKAAEEIAKSVEQKIINSDINRVTTTLIKALTDNELLARGYTSSLRHLSSVTLPFDDISQMLQKDSEINLIDKTGKQVVAPYVLSKIYSEDIADAYRRGMIFIHGLSHPFFTYEKFAGTNFTDKSSRDIKAEIITLINQVLTGKTAKLFFNTDDMSFANISELCDIASLISKSDSIILDIQNEKTIEHFSKIAPVKSVILLFSSFHPESDVFFNLYRKGWNVTCENSQKRQTINNKITINLPQSVYRTHGKDLDSVIEEIYRSIELAVQAYQQYSFYLKENERLISDNSYGAIDIIGLHEAVSILTGAGVFDSNESMACTRVLLNVLQNGLKQAAKSYNLKMKLIVGEPNESGKRFSIIDQSLFPELFGFLPLQSETLESVIPPYNSFCLDPWNYDSLEKFIIAAVKIFGYFDSGSFPLKIKIDDSNKIIEVINLMLKNNCGFSIKSTNQQINIEPMENINQKKLNL